MVCSSTINSPKITWEFTDQKDKNYTRNGSGLQLTGQIPDK